MHILSQSCGFVNTIPVVYKKFKFNRVKKFLKAAFTLSQFYNTADLWTAPEPETPEQEYLNCYKSIQKHRRKRGSERHTVLIP
jgi:hypothetical protein